MPLTHICNPKLQRTFELKPRALSTFARSQKYDYEYSARFDSSATLIAETKRVRWCIGLVPPRCGISNKGSLVPQPGVCIHLTTLVANANSECIRRPAGSVCVCRRDRQRHCPVHSHCCLQSIACSWLPGSCRRALDVCGRIQQIWTAKARPRLRMRLQTTHRRLRGTC